MDVPAIPRRFGAPASERPGRPDGPTAPFAIDRPSAAVRLSERGKLADVQKAIVEKALGAINERFSRDDLFTEAGRDDYLSSIAQPTDLSAEATAGRILGGITGYIYGAFKLANEAMGSEEFEKFESQVLDGFERGMAEGGRALGVLDPKLAGEVQETERLVREGLDTFFADERERIRMTQAA